MKVSTLLEGFENISLKSLEKKAGMLHRSENKYIVNKQRLNLLLQEMELEFDVLSIEGRRDFRYETIYFDDNATCFYQHQQGKRQRFKVRTRKYSDHENLVYFELKLKQGRGKTKKIRIKCDKSEHGKVSDDAFLMVQKQYKKLYSKTFPYNLKPTISMNYQRITLVAKQGNERLTIDYALSFSSEEKKILTPEDFIIIEVKSEHGRGIADKIMRKQSIRDTQCSKFCLGMILLEKEKKTNHFRPLLKRHFHYMLA